MSKKVFYFALGIWITILVISMIMAVYYVLTDHKVYVEYRPVNVSNGYVKVDNVAHKAYIIYNNQTVATEDLVNAYSVNGHYIAFWSVIAFIDFFGGLILLAVLADKCD